jgi:hypothetical protein
MSEVESCTLESIGKGRKRVAGVPKRVRKTGKKSGKSKKFSVKK